MGERERSEHHLVVSMRGPQLAALLRTAAAYKGILEQRRLFFVLEQADGQMELPFEDHLHVPYVPQDDEESSLGDF